MATARERHLMAALMGDPAFQEAWAGLRGTVAALDRAILEDPDAFVSAVCASLVRVEAVMDQRPELAALIQATECSEH